MAILAKNLGEAYQTFKLRAAHRFILWIVNRVPTRDSLKAVPYWMPSIASSLSHVGVGLVLLLLTAGCSRKDTTTAPTSSMRASTTFELTGRVLENESPGRPIPSARVAIGDGPNAGQSTMSDSAGSFRFTDLAQSGFTVTASADNYFPQSRGVTLTSNQALTFQLNRSVSRVPTTRFVMSGTATDDSGRARTNAGVYIDFLSSDVPGTYFAHASAVTDGAGAYRAQFDAVPGLMSHHMTAWACLRPDSGYASDCQWIAATAPDISQNFHTYSIPRLPAGQSTTVTVSPADSLCLNNVQDTPGLLDYLCRTVRIVSPTDGLVTIEAVSDDGGVHPPLEVELLAERGPCCSERLQNPTTIAVTAGIDITVNVEILWGSATPQTFVLTSKVAQP
jgi:hypothetical protein